jgi:hypothetical protein
MRTPMIIISTVFVFIGLYITMSWGGPLADLASSGEPRITGIDSIKAAIQSRAGQARRPQYMARARQPQHLPRQASRIKKPSLAQLLSDETSTGKTKQMEKNADVGLKPSSSGQYASAEYFPTSPGTTWTYLVDGSKTSNVKVLPEVAIVGGIETSIAVNTKTGVSICFTSDSDGILIHRELIPNSYIQGTDIVDLLVTFIPPIRLADGLVEAAQTAYSIGTARYTLLPQRRVIDLDYTATYTLQTRKEVAIPAGTLDALHFHGTFAISGDLESETFYLSKNIGLVKGLVKSADHKRVTELSFISSGP